MRSAVQYKKQGAASRDYQVLKSPQFAHDVQAEDDRWRVSDSRPTRNAQRIIVNGGISDTDESGSAVHDCQDENAYDIDIDDVDISGGDLSCNWNAGLARRASFARHDHENVVLCGILEKHRVDLGIVKWLKRFFVIRGSHLIQVGTKKTQKDLRRESQTPTAMRPRSSSTGNAKPNKNANKRWGKKAKRSKKNKQKKNKNIFQLNSGERFRRSNSDPMQVYLNARNQEIHEKVVLDLTLCHVKRRPRSEDDEHNILSRASSFRNKKKSWRRNPWRIGPRGNSHENQTPRKGSSSSDTESSDTDASGTEAKSASKARSKFKDEQQQTLKKEGRTFAVWCARTTEPAIFRCENEGECAAWVAAIEQAIAAGLVHLSTSPSSGRAIEASTKEGSNEGGGLGLDTSAGPSRTAHQQYLKTPMPAGMEGRDPVIVNREAKAVEAVIKDGVHDLMKKNRFCADCGKEDVAWGSLNLGVLFCIECSSGHRDLGAHFSQVQSLLLDRAAWTRHQLAFMHCAGNKAVNRLWECNLDPASKPTPSSSLGEKILFIRRKYAQRRYVRAGLARSHRLAFLGAEEADLADMDRESEDPSKHQILMRQRSPKRLINRAGALLLKATENGSMVDVLTIFADYGDEVLEKVASRVPMILAKRASEATTETQFMTSAALNQFYLNNGINLT